MKKREKETEGWEKKHKIDEIINFLEKEKREALEKSYQINENIQIITDEEEIIEFTPEVIKALKDKGLL